MYLSLEGERTELLHRMEQWVQKHQARQHAAQVEVQNIQRIVCFGKWKRRKCITLFPTPGTQGNYHPTSQTITDSNILHNLLEWSCRVR